MWLLILYCIHQSYGGLGWVIWLQVYIFWDYEGLIIFEIIMFSLLLLFQLFIFHIWSIILGFLFPLDLAYLSCTLLHLHYDFYLLVVNGYWVPVDSILILYFKTFLVQITILSIVIDVVIMLVKFGDRGALRARADLFSIFYFCMVFLFRDCCIFDFDSTHILLFRGPFTDLTRL